MKATTAVTAVTILGVLVAAGLTQADVFSMGGTRNPTTGVWTGDASLEFVTVGDPGNARDTRYVSQYDPGYGQVNYSYQMGKYDITSAQYAQFLNAVAATDTYGLYNTNMATAPIPNDPWLGGGNPGSVGCGITRSLGANGYTYSVTPGWENMPVNWVSWGDALRFVNWLANGQPTGVAEGPGTTETGSYTLNGATTAPQYNGITRNPSATYVLPSADEWYKAAYYKGGSTNAYWTYPTRSDSAPSNNLSASGTNNANYLVVTGNPPFVNSYYTDPANYLTPVGSFAGSPGPYGTFDMGGDVGQWMDTWDTGSVMLDGGCYGSNLTSMIASSFPHFDAPPGGDPGMGFRVALAPEPTSLLLVLVCAEVCAMRRRLPFR